MDDATIAAEIAHHVLRRGHGKSICPSEVARALAADWRPLMPRVRHVAQAMADRGEVAITRKGRAVRADTVRGPLRLSMPDSPETD